MHPGTLVLSRCVTELYVDHPLVLSKPDLLHQVPLPRSELDRDSMGVVVVSVMPVGVPLASGDTWVLVLAGGTVGYSWSGDWVSLSPGPARLP